MNNIIVRNINGVKGFCIYKEGVPYTYIRTRDAIELLGLVEIKKNNTKKLRIKSFGEKYLFVTKNDIRLKNMSPSDYGIDITPNYSISIDRSMDEITGASCCAGDIIAPIQLRLNDGTIANISKYDDILPEYILDRVVFSIANKLRSSTAEEFRSALIWEVIPHFQQTATQDQINKVPILNQTTGFIHDNKSYSIFSNSSYNFYKHILDIHVERIRVLLESDDFTKTYAGLMQNFSDIIKLEAGKDIFDNVRNARDVLYNNTGIYKSTANLCLDDYIDTIICDSLLYNYFIMYLNTQIRQLEHEIMDNMNSQQQESDFTDRVLKQVVEFIPVDKRTHSYKINPGDYMFDYRLMIKASNY